MIEMKSDGVSLAAQEDVPEKKSSLSTTSLPNEKQDVPNGDEAVIDVSIDKDLDVQPSWFIRNRDLVRRVKLCALAALILAWWISATVLRDTRHRWIVQTLFAWSFIAIIAFRFIPNSVVTRPVEAVWIPLVQRPFFALPKFVRYGVGWLALLAIIMGSAFGFKVENVGYLRLTLSKYIYIVDIHPLIRALWSQGTNYGDRAISVLGLVVFQFGFWATSRHRSHIQWQTVIVGLFMQQAIALFVLKSGAGFHLFNWLATLATDFLNKGLVGAAFFFDQDTVNTKHWFFVNVVRLPYW
jgi:concentrative nucleoside transporter, CNT family